MRQIPALYLMRHGQTVWNTEGRLQGSLHSPLTPTGIRQAKAQANIAANIPGQCFCSPQGRARQTADLVFAGRDWSVDPCLAEIGIGNFAGRLLTDLQAEKPQLFQGQPLDWYNHCPQGEGFAALETRCRSFLDALNRPTLVVTHGITLRMLRVLALGIPVDQMAADEMEQGVVYHVQDKISLTLRDNDNILHR